MIKVILIALIGYFILSRLFGRFVFIKRVVHQPYTNANPNSRPQPETRVEFTEKKAPKTGGDYIDYEEIK